MRKAVVAIAALTMLITSLVASGDAGADADPRALSAVSRMLATIGGSDAPYRVDSIAFTFAVEADGTLRGSRRHVWYPRTGRHRLERTDKEGAHIVVDWNLVTGEGWATTDDVAMEGDALAEELDSAHQMWINDTYWLLMPYKLLDPGVELAWDGEETIDDELYDKVRVTFEDVGLTPGDTYWALISRSTGRMDRWAFVLQERDGPPTAFDWIDYRYYGPLLLSNRKQKVGASTAILTSAIEVE